MNPGGKTIPSRDPSKFKVKSGLRTNPSRVERLLPPSEAVIALRKSPVVTKISPLPNPPMSRGVARNSYLIQLGALSSEDSARREWNRIGRRHPDLVRNRFPTIVPVELNSHKGKLFRLQMGPIGGSELARFFCAKFSVRGQDCYVVK